MGDSPEEILARLTRYRDSLRAAGALPLPAHTAPLGTRVTGPVEAPDRTWTAAGARRRGLNAVEATLLGQVLATVAAVVGIVVFERFTTFTAVVVVAAMIAVGLGALLRRIPLSLWWTLGALIGGALGRWS